MSSLAARATGPSMHERVATRSETPAESRPYLPAPILAYAPQRGRRARPLLATVFLLLGILVGLAGTGITLVAFVGLTHPFNGSDGVAVQLLAGIVGLLIGCVVICAAIRCMIAAHDWIAGRSS